VERGAKGRRMGHTHGARSVMKCLSRYASSCLDRGQRGALGFIASQESGESGSS
jgi:hypothetical protein